MNRPARIWLPALLREVADRFGEDIALTLARDLGGRFFTLPSRPRAEHPIARSVGENVLAFLVERYGALERVTIPKGPDVERMRRLVTLRRMVAQGATANAIAAATGMHVRWVYAQRAKLAADSAQADLFAREEA